MDRLEAESSRREKHKHCYLGLTQYLFLCCSHVTHGFNYQPPHGGVKTSVSVRYGTGCISFFFLPNSIKTLEKRLPTFHACLLVRHKESKGEEGPVVWIGHGFCLFAGYKFLRLPVFPFPIDLRWTQPQPSDFCEGDQTNEDGAETIGEGKKAEGNKSAWGACSNEHRGVGKQERNMGKEWGRNEGVEEQESTMTLPHVSDVCYDPCTFVSACSWWCVEGPAAYLRLGMLWSVASDSPTSLWPPVIQNMPLPAQLLHER